MFLSADTLSYIYGLGLSGEQLVELVRRLDGDAQAVAPVADAAREKKRERDRERYQKRIRGETASENAGETEAEFSAKPLAESGEQDAPAPVHTRGEETLPRLVDKPNLTTLKRAIEHDDLDWPDEAKPSRAYLDRLEAALVDAAGRALASPAIAPKVKVLSAILALGRAGDGPPCDMQADVLPTVRARSARAPPASICSWDFFSKAIREARDKRLTGAPAIEAVQQGNRHERPSQQSAKFAAKQANMDRAFNGAQRAIARAAR